MHAPPNSKGGAHTAAGCSLHERARSGRALSCGASCTAGGAVAWFSSACRLRSCRGSRCCAAAASGGCCKAVVTLLPLLAGLKGCAGRKQGEAAPSEQVGLPAALGCQEDAARARDGDDGASALRLLSCIVV